MFNQILRGTATHDGFSLPLMCTFTIIQVTFVQHGDQQWNRPWNHHPWRDLTDITDEQGCLKILIAFRDALDIPLWKLYWYYCTGIYVP